MLTISPSPKVNRIFLQPDEDIRSWGIHSPGKYSYYTNHIKILEFTLAMPLNNSEINPDLKMQNTSHNPPPSPNTDEVPPVSERCDFRIFLPLTQRFTLESSPTNQGYKRMMRGTSPKHKGTNYMIQWVEWPPESRGPILYVQTPMRGAKRRTFPSLFAKACTWKAKLTCLLYIYSCALWIALIPQLSCF